MYRGSNGRRRLTTVDLFSGCEPSEVQDLGEIVPQLLEIKAKAEVPIRFRVQIEVGNGTEMPPDDVVKKINQLLGELKDGFGLEP